LLSKQDSVNFKNDLEKLLAKYGLKTMGYQINVQSNNQSGGQTAFTITNIVNNYDLKDSKPQIKFISEKKWPEKELIQDGAYTGKDSLYKTSIYFEYYSLFQKDNIVAIVEKVYGLEYVKVYYPETIASVIRTEVLGQEVKGSKLINPINGKMAVDIYTKKTPLNLRKFTFIIVDSIEYRMN
jgi:hypothetical protein